MYFSIFVQIPAVKMQSAVFALIAKFKIIALNAVATAIILEILLLNAKRKPCYATDFVLATTVAIVFHYVNLTPIAHAARNA